MLSFVYLLALVNKIALIVGGIILLISWVMKEAYKISQEQYLMI